MPGDHERLERVVAGGDEDPGVMREGDQHPHAASSDQRVRRGIRVLEHRWVDHREAPYASIGGRPGRELVTVGTPGHRAGPVVVQRQAGDLPAPFGPATTICLLSGVKATLARPPGPGRLTAGRGLTETAQSRAVPSSEVVAIIV